jgi:hypothetical protein
VAQVVESLPSNCEALSSNASTTKEKKRKEIDSGIVFDMAEVMTD